MDGLGKLLMAVGGSIFLFGAVLWLAGRLGWLPLGRLPGDLVIHRNGFGFYFPIVTCLLLSVIGSLVLWLIGAIRR